MFQNLTWSTAIRRSCAFVFAAALFVAVSAGHAYPEGSEQDDPGAWGWSRMTKVVRGRKLKRGIALYMKENRRPAIAFRCDRGKLYAFVAVVPMDFHSLLGKGFRNPAEWQVEYSLNGEPQRQETWVWTYGGKIMMSEPGESAWYLFNAVRQQSELVFQRKHGDKVTINVPAIEPSRYNGFIAHCGFEDVEPAPLRPEIDT